MYQQSHLRVPCWWRPRHLHVFNLPKTCTCCAMNRAPTSHQFPTISPLPPTPVRKIPALHHAPLEPSTFIAHNSPMQMNTQQIKSQESHNRLPRASGGGGCAADGGGLSQTRLPRASGGGGCAADGGGSFPNSPPPGLRGRCQRPR